MRIKNYPHIHYMRITTSYEQCKFGLWTTRNAVILCMVLFDIIHFHIIDFWLSLPQHSDHSDKMDPCHAMFAGLWRNNCPGKMTVCYFISNSLKPVVRPSVRSSAKVSFGPERPLETSTGARKKPPVGGLNFLVYQYLSILYP